MSLEGTEWALEMDIGQEQGSWMPPVWGRSGVRATPTATVAFGEGGTLAIKEKGYFDGPVVKLRDGGWELVDGERVRFWLEHDGLSKGNDLTLDAGRLYFACGAWGNLLGKRGTLTIRQKRFGFLPFLPGPEASFIVGTFRCKPVEPPET